MTSMSPFNLVSFLLASKIYSSNFIYVHDYTSPKSYLILSQDVFFTCPSNFIIWSPSARRWLVRIIWKGSLDHLTKTEPCILMITTLIKRVTYTSSKTEVWTLWHITVKKRKTPWKIRKEFNHKHSRTFFPVLYGDLSSRANPKDEKTKRKLIPVEL